MKIAPKPKFSSLKHRAIDTDAMRKTLEDGAKRRIGHDLYLSVLAGTEGGKIIMLHRKREPIESKSVHFLKVWLVHLGWHFQHTTGASKGLWAGLFKKGESVK